MSLLKRYTLAKRQLLAISVKIDHDQLTAVKCCHAKIIAKELTFDLFDEFSSIEELKQNVKGQAIYLHIDGKDCLQVESLIADEDSLGQSFPAYNKKNFIAQSIQLASNANWNLIRKESYDQIIQAFQNAEYPVLHCSVGKTAFSPLNNLGLKNQLIATDNYDIAINSQQISSIQKKEQVVLNEQLNLLGTYIPSSHVATALQCLFALDSGLILKQTDDILHNNEAFRYKSILEKYVKVTLSVFFISLLLNFVVFGLLDKKNAALQSQSYEYSHAQQIADSLSTKNADIEQFLTDYTINKNVRISNWLDDLAQSKPANIQLTEINLYPSIATDDFGTEQQQYNNKIAIISGLANNNQDLVEWLATVSSLQAVTNAEIEQINESSNSQQHDFTIQLSLNDG